MNPFKIALAGAALSAVMAHAQVPGFYERPQLRLVGASNIIAGSYLSFRNTGGCCDYSLAVARQGGNGVLDPAFGDKGIAHVPIWGQYEFAYGLALQPDGKILVAGVAPDPGELDTSGLPMHPGVRSRYYVGVSRLTPDGTVDKSFNATGQIVFHVGPEVQGEEDSPLQTYVGGVEARADGKIVVFGRREMPYDDPVQWVMAGINSDGTIDASFPITYPDLRPVEIAFTGLIEYVNDRDQYFLTASPSEFGALDRSATPAWYRTGYAFRAPRSADVAADSVPVCRFLGKQEFGLGTYFFTADPQECASLAADPIHAWALQSTEAFRVEIPDRATGACIRGGMPIFRLLANRSDSAHRFTTSYSVKAGALAKGWFAEGYGPRSVAMCGAP
jgi:uncharacterized delta-60 repeat protein